MDALLQLRLLLFGAESLPSGSEQQQAKALQLKCFLTAADVPESDRTYEAADALLAAGAAARRDRLWGAAMHAAGLDKEFCVLTGSLADLDLSSCILKASSLAGIAEDAAAARNASAKAHTALLGYHQHRLQQLQQQRQQQQQQQAAHRQGSAGPSDQTTSAPNATTQQCFGPAASCQGGPLAPPRPGGAQGPSRLAFRHPQPPQQGAAGTGPGSGGGGFGPHLQQQQQQPDGPGRWQAGPSGPALGGNGGGGNGANGGGASGRWAPGKRPAALDGVPPVDEDGGGAGGGGGCGGFRSAKAQLVAEALRKGQAPPTFSNQAPRAGLMRPSKKQQTGGGGGGAGGGGGGSSVRGFVPPFVAKAVEGPPGNGGGAGCRGGGAGTAGDFEDIDSPYPPKLLQLLNSRQLLSFGPEGQLILPEPLAVLDPKIVENVFNEVLDRSAPIAWDDIAGQDHAKGLVQEMVVWPIKNPQLFRGARAPPKGLLLFGPPGTGKTLIGKAVAANICATFFAISASSLTSKWIGEGEKMVRALFALAGVLQPSVIFIDEIDSIMTQRKSEGEHEASRRMKTEFLIQMEGCDPGSGERRVLVIGATNRPEELDEAARRRLPKQLYIPLPCARARKAMLTNAFKQGSEVATTLSDADLDKVVERTAGYSGSDMKNLIQEACQGPVRDLFRSRGNVSNVAPSDLRPVQLRDFQMASKAQKRTVSDAEVERYEQYDRQFGAKYMEEGDGRGDGAGDGDDDEW